MDAGNMLKPPLARGELRCIGGKRPSMNTVCILRKDPAFGAPFFNPVVVAEPSIEATHRDSGAV